MGEAGVAQDFHAPPGGIGEVEVQPIEFEGGHRFHLLFEKIQGVEVTTHIDHRTSPSVGGSIVNVGTGERAVFAPQLNEGLQGPKAAETTGGTHHHTIGSDVEGVGFKRFCTRRLQKLQRKDRGRAVGVFGDRICRNRCRNLPKVGQ